MIDGILRLFAPHYCLGCEVEGNLLCAACADMFQNYPSVCYRCGVATANNETCAACCRKTGLHTVQALTPYEGVAKDVVWKLKFDSAQAAARDMAWAMRGLLPSAETDFIVTHVPTSTSHVRIRGYDQAHLLARELAKLGRLSFLPCLARIGQHRQVGASRSQRFEQLSDALRPRSGIDFRGAHIVLIDDVLTTGATIEAAARVLKAAGAGRVDAIVFART